VSNDRPPFDEPAGHVSLDELAELDEGLLPAERAGSVRQHLRGCAECRDRAETIIATRSALADLPAAPIPADVVARLDRALADAAPENTATVVPHVTEIRRRHTLGRPTMAASAAAAAIVLAAIAIVVGHYHHSGGSPQSGAGSTAAAPAQGSAGDTVGANTTGSFTQSSTGQTYTPTNLAALVPGLIAPNTPTSSGNLGSANGSAATSSPAAGPTPAASSRASGKDDVTSPRAATDTAPSSASGSGTVSGSRELSKQPVPKELRRIAGSHARLLQCAARLTDKPGAVPEAIDFARWTNGQYVRAPSILFVFNGIRPSTLTVYVTNPTCTGDTLIRDLAIIPLPS
jgi:hypothetical protein